MLVILTTSDQLPKGQHEMRKIILIVSLVISLVLYLYFQSTGDGAVLAFVLLGLLVSFTCAMMLLSKK